MSTRTKIREILKKIKRKGITGKSIKFWYGDFNNKRFIWHGEVNRSKELYGMSLATLCGRNHTPPTIWINTSMSRPTSKLIEKHILHEIGHMYYGWLIQYRNKFVKDVIQKMHIFAVQD